MGTIYYDGADSPIRLDDRILAHLKVVIATKLRRNESFTLSFQHGEDGDLGRTTIWLHPSIPLRFVFDEPEMPEIDPQLVHELANSVNISGGISLKREHVLRAGDPENRQDVGPASADAEQATVTAADEGASEG